jgi:anti-sigma factor RsiW
MSAYVDGELATGAVGRIERHLGECHECRRLLADLRRMLAGLRRLSTGASRTFGADGADRPEGPRIAAAVLARLGEPPAGN